MKNGAGGGQGSDCRGPRGTCCGAQLPLLGNTRPQEGFQWGITDQGFDSQGEDGAEGVRQRLGDEMR